MLNTSNIHPKQTMTIKRLQNNIYNNLCQNYLDYCIDFFRQNRTANKVTVCFNEDGLELFATFKDNFSLEIQHNIFVNVNYEFDLPFVSNKIIHNNNTNILMIKKFFKQIVNKLDAKTLIKLLPFITRNKKLDPLVLSTKQYSLWIYDNLNQILRLITYSDKYIISKNYINYLISFLNLDTNNFNQYLLVNFNKIKSHIAKDHSQLSFFFNYLISIDHIDAQAQRLMFLLTKECIRIHPYANNSTVVFLLSQVCSIHKVVTLPKLPINYLFSMYYYYCELDSNADNQLMQDNFTHYTFAVRSNKDLDLFINKLKYQNDSVLSKILKISKECHPTIEVQYYSSRINKYLDELKEESKFNCYHNYDTIWLILLYIFYLNKK